jgi:hypothetical protein
MSTIWIVTLQTDVEGGGMAQLDVHRRTDLKFYNLNLGTKVSICNINSEVWVYLPLGCLVYKR